MSVKFSQLPVTTNLAIPANILFPVVDNTGPTSFTTSLTTISSQILSGNAASATKLATARTINGVSFDGTANITITTAISSATTNTLGGVIVPAVGTSGITNSTGTIGIAIATVSQIGGVKIGSGIAVSGDGTISVTSTPVATSSTSGSVIVPTTGGLKIDGSGNISGNTLFHAFSFDANYNLIYSKIDDTTITITTDGINSPYVTYDVGTSQYAYSLDASGNLIATFSS